MDDGFEQIFKDIEKQEYQLNIQNFYDGEKYDASAVWQYVALIHGRAKTNEDLQEVSLLLDRAKPVISRYMADEFKHINTVENALIRVTADKVELLAQIKIWQRLFVMLAGFCIISGAACMFLLLRRFIGV